MAVQLTDPVSLIVSSFLHCVFLYDIDVFSLITSFLLSFVFPQEAAGFIILSSPFSPPASVAFIDDILMAFGGRENCMLIHGGVDGI